ncbi:MAG: adenine phosphoribosyltransferase [Acidobacteriota bacterium]|nr:MAG: adenine phosphoribosyltransferase [Acidobacteriota bacterium]
MTPDDDLRRHIADVPDFPKPGILFRDLTPLLREPAAMRRVIEDLSRWAAELEPTVVVGIESRGFLFGVPIAQELGVGLVPARKPGKLPRETLREEYALEYGTNALEIHRDAIRAGDRALVVDDLLATGGTAAATRRLIERAGGTVAGFGFVVELESLGGRSRLGDAPVLSLVRYA